MFNVTIEPEKWYNEHRSDFPTYVKSMFEENERKFYLENGEVTLLNLKLHLPDIIADTWRWYERVHQMPLGKVDQTYLPNEDENSSIICYFFGKCPEFVEFVPEWWERKLFLMFEQLFPDLTLEKLCEAIRRANRILLESTDNPGSILKVFESVLAALDRVLGNAL